MICPFVEKRYLCQDKDQRLQDMRIAVLFQGGVDSAVAVHRICEMGYKPDLFYIKIGMEGEGLSCTAEEDIELSTATARRYGLHLEVVDLQKQYWELVVGYAMERARRGLTPNPDVMCNKLIKFGCFEQEVGSPVRQNRHGTLCHGTRAGR